jgi:hypothetical protein
MIPPCPECGGALFFDRSAEKVRHIAPPFFVVGVSRLAEHRVRCVMAFCAECEFSMEVPVEGAGS